MQGREQAQESAALSVFVRCQQRRAGRVPGERWDAAAPSLLRGSHCGPNLHPTEPTTVLALVIHSHAP